MNRQFKGINALVQVWLVVLVATWYGLTLAQVPDTLGYQGHLTDASGAPITGSMSMIFTLYDVGGAPKYTETQTVSVNAGVFNVAIGSVVPMNLPFDIPYFLGVKVGSDPEMTPRQPLLSSPYAQRAITANLLAATATVSGSQITGSITGATLPTAQLAGTIATAQIANNSVTQANLSPSGGTSGQVLGTNGTNLQWQNAAGGGTVTSVATGTGLTGGPITASGTINLASTQLLPAIACAATQIPKWNGTAWACAADDSGGASGGLVGQVLTGTGGTPAWSDSPSLGGNLLLATSTASAGNVYKGGAPFMHNFGTSNTFVGSNAGNLVMSGNSNAAFGDQALAANGSGYDDTAVGYRALASNTSGHDNVAIGVSALEFNSTGGYNTVMGVNALGAENNIGDGNTATGYAALLGNISGAYNTASGFTAMRGNTTGSYNTATGTEALYGSHGNYNTGTGYRALAGGGGVQNTAIGADALLFNDSGINNTASGISALRSNASGSSNTANGAFALDSNYDGSYNTASGFQALTSNVSGELNTAMGSGALALTVADGNTGVGVEALFYNGYGYYNTAIGNEALFQNTTGGYNTASGLKALNKNTTGHDNTATGVGALYSNDGGTENSAHGDYALYGSVSGSFNTAMGGKALFSSSGGSYNVALGFNAGLNVTSGSFNVLIANAGAGADANTIRIGDGNQNRAFIAGISGVNVTGSTVVVNASGQLGVVVSSGRFKDDIADMSDTSAALMKLRPVTFRYKAGIDSGVRSLQYGLIAEEVAEIYPGLVAHSADGQIESVRYQFLAPMLLNEYQKQQRRIEAQAAEVIRITNVAAGQTARIAELERDRQAHVARIEALESQSVEIAELKQQVAQLARLQTLALDLAQLAHPSHAGSSAAFK